MMRLDEEPDRETKGGRLPELVQLRQSSALCFPVRFLIESHHPVLNSTMISTAFSAMCQFLLNHNPITETSKSHPSQRPGKKTSSPLYKHPKIAASRSVPVSIPTIIIHFPTITSFKILPRFQQNSPIATLTNYPNWVSLPS